MIPRFITVLTALSLASASSATPTGIHNKIEARKPDHWGTVAWGHIRSRACGHTGNATEYVAAVSPLLYDSEQPCGRVMVVTYGENQVNVEVVNKCADCIDNDLVLSTSAFQALAGNLTVGLINATWDFQDAL